MDYDDLSQAGQRTPTPAHGPVEELGRLPRPDRSGGGSGGGLDQRAILLVSLLVGAVVFGVVLYLIGLPLWLVVVFVVADLGAMSVLVRRLPPSR